MNDADPRLSKLILVHAVLGAALNLLVSIRTRGPRDAATLFALGVGLPAVGEVLATGPLNLLRHRTKPRVMGVPVGILLGWYCAINGSLTVAERLLAKSSIDDGRVALPLAAALVGTNLDLILEPFGLDTGLWEWRSDGSYAADIKGANGRRGVPLVNYAGWLVVVAGVVSVHGRLLGRQSSADRLSALLLLPPYLAAAVWALKNRRFRYLFYSAPFPLALAAAVVVRHDHAR